MSLSILNNISALNAENSMSTTQTNLQNTLTQLSTGLRINSGADDAAGLSIANGMSANIAALTQSGQNATNATGLLQTADGALSQVTSLLNRAVTLATEASSDGLTNNQSGALNTEFQSIISSINNIGANTNFNGANVFSSAAITPYLSDGTLHNNLLGQGTQMTVGTMNSGTVGIGTFATASLTGDGVPADDLAGGVITTHVAAADSVAGGDTVTVGGTTYTLVGAGATPNAVTSTQTTNEVQVGSDLAQTMQNLANAINGGPGAGTTYSAGMVANASAQASVSGSVLTVTSLSAGAGGTLGLPPSGDSIAFSTTNANAVFTGVSAGGDLTGGTGTADLLTADNAQTALVSITNAINTVSQMRGNLGADINQLSAASNVMTAQTTNLQSADNGIMNADIGKTVANMTQYNILQSTGMSALQQANQAQQAVLKLLQ